MKTNKFIFNSISKIETNINEEHSTYNNNITNDLTNNINDTEKHTIVININENINRKIKEEKIRKHRIETNTWMLTNIDLTYENQYRILTYLYNIIILNVELNTCINNKNDIKLYRYFKSHIKCKILNYKQQDLNKNMYNNIDFITFNYVVSLLYNSQLKCYYCSVEIYILYELVRENKQWTLDRIDNDIGHNINNLVICCLECNLRRRRTNKDAFFFTKNLNIVKK
jgi:hypothetical protein